MDSYLAERIRAWKVEPTEANAQALAAAVARSTEVEMEPRKVLISQGYGSEWSCYASGAVRDLMLTWQPLIDACEAGQDINEEHPAVRSLVAAIEALGEEAPYFGGCTGLVVVEVSAPFAVEGYDGAESLRDGSSLFWPFD
jgi:hypothetical protein